MSEKPDTTPPSELDTSAINSDIEASPIDAVQPAPEHPRKNLPLWKWILSLIGLYLGALLYGLDTTIAADVQVSVYETFQDIENLPWVGLGFPMASVAVILLVGRAYGLFDVKPLMLGSILIFEVGSAVCGAAPSSQALIVGRVIAGIGGAGMYLGALTYIAAFSSSQKETTLLNALIGLAWGVGAILGPVVGGGFAVSKATWRWAFYINLPLAALWSPIYFFIFPSHNPKPSVSTRSKLVTIDWVGTVLNGALFVLFMIVVSFGGSTYPWKSGSAIALWIVWGVVLVSYILQQYFAIFTTPERRIFPIQFLKSRTMLLLFITTAGAAAANATTLYYIPLFFQFTRNDSALQAAVRLLPFIVVFIVFVMLAGGLLPVVGRYNLFYLAGGAITLIGGALIFTIDANTSISKIYGYEVLIAAGSGLVFQNAYTVAAAKVGPAHSADAIGFINVSQIGTIAMSLAIAGALFQNLGFAALKNELAPFRLPDDYVQSALAGTISPIFSGPATDPKIAELAVVIVATTIQRVFGMVVAAGAVIFAGALGMPWEKLKLDVVAGG